LILAYPGFCAARARVGSCWAGTDDYDELR